MRLRGHRRRPERSYVLRSEVDRAVDRDRRSGGEAPTAKVVQRLALEARGAEDARRDDERNDPGRVLEPNRRLVRVAREKVDREVGHRPEEEQRLEEPEAEERDEQQSYEAGLVPVRDRMHERHRVGDELVRHAPRRPADSRVSTGERLDTVGREVRDHPQEVEERDGESRREHAETEQPVPSPDRVPDPEAADREGISSFVVNASSATTENATSLSSSRNQIA